MSKKLNYLLLAAMFIFSACSSGNDDSEPNNKGNDTEDKTTIVENYQKKFKAACGEIDPEHNWGFENYSDMLQDIPEFAPRTGLTNSYSSMKDFIMASLDKTIYEPNHHVLNWDNFGVRSIYENEYIRNKLDYVDFKLYKTYVKDNKNNWKQREEGTPIYTYYTYPSTYFMENCKPDFMLKYSINGQEYESTDFHLIYVSNSDHHYAGFDINGDHNYSDIILQIEEYTPGEIGFLVEDLDNPDFDFNDIIFGMSIYEKNGERYVEYSIYAVGNKTPTYINGVELHGLFGVPTNTAVDFTHFYAIFTTKYNNETNIVIGENRYNLEDMIFSKGQVPNIICINMSTFNRMIRDGMRLNEGEAIYNQFKNFKFYVNDHTKSW